MWQRYIKTKDKKNYNEYTKLRNQVRSFTRKNRKDKEREIAEQVKANPKKFWYYVNSKTKTKNGIPDLVYTEDGIDKNTTNDAEKIKSALRILFLSIYN